jgi:hypothetical protein
MNSRSFLAAMCLAFTAAVLTGCGGGAGAGALARVTAQEAPQGNYNLQAAFNNSITDNSTLAFTVEGTANGVPVQGRGQYEQSMLETVSEFDHRGGALRKTTPVRMTLDVNQRQVQVESTAQDFYSRQGMQFLGRLGPGPQREFVEVTHYAGLPSEARVGASGTLYTANRYSDAVRRVLTGTTQATFMLEPDTAPESALLVIRVTDSAPDGAEVGTATTVYRVTQSGSARRVSESTSDIAGNNNLRATFL